MTRLGGDALSDGPLLQGKRAPPFKMVCAVGLATWILSGLWFGLRVLQEHHEKALDEQKAVHNGGLLDVVIVTMAFPLSAILALVLMIPLFVYIGDHAAFASLSMLRPDHYVR